MRTSQAELLQEKGVYALVNTINNKMYIGSTIMSFSKRCNHHVNRLRNNKHKNQHLQNAFNKYGEDNFKIVVLEMD